MMRWLLWQIEDLAVYLPRWVKELYWWYRIGRVR
jgi:hypothetical protein